MEKLVSIKRTAAVCCAVAMAAGTLSGCGSAGYVLKYGDTEIKPGVYINSIITEMNSQMNTLYYAGKLQAAEDAFSQEIDGKSFTEAVKENALKNAKEIAAVDAKFKELGLELSADDVASIEDTISSAWGSNGDMLEYVGVSKESFRLCAEHDYKKDAIFDYYYADGGIEEVSDVTLQQYVNDNYIRYKIISISKSTAEDEETKKAENEEAEALLNEYYERAQELDFAGFDALIDEYNAYKQAQEEAAQAEAEELTTEDGTETELPAVDVTDSTTDESTTDESTDDASAAEETTSEESADIETASVTESTIESHEAENTESAVTETVGDEESTADESAADESKADETTSDESAADESKADETTSDEDAAADDTEVTDETDSSADAETESAEEADPYVNEYVMNATEMLDTTSETYDESYAAMIKAFKEQPYNKAATYMDNEYSYVLFITEDIAGRPDYVEDNKATLLKEIKGDEFDGLVTSWVDALGINVNDKAVKKYGVKVIYDRESEYYKKNPQS